MLLGGEFGAAGSHVHDPNAELVTVLGVVALHTGDGAVVLLRPGGGGGAESLVSVRVSSH